MEQITPPQIKISLESKQLCYPITAEIVDQTIEWLNVVFNSTEFRAEIIKNKFVCTNKPELCGEDNFISGLDVYNDLISENRILLNLKVRRLKHLWKRWISKTKGETKLAGNTIKSYTWWLTNEDPKELAILYASHVGHEIFHTKYYKYKHNPKKGSQAFENDRDVTYKIDDIIENLMRKHFNN